MSGEIQKDGPSRGAIIRLLGLALVAEGMRVRLSGTLITFEVCEISIIIDVAVVALIYFIAAGQVDFSVDQGADLVR